MLASDPNIQAIVGTARPDRSNGIFPNVAPDEPNIPYVVYTQVHRDTVMGYQGVNRYQDLRYQIGCYGSPYRAVKQLATAVKNKLDGFLGVLTDGTFVFNTVPLSEHDEPEPQFHGTIYGVILDYSFQVAEELFTLLTSAGVNMSAQYSSNFAPGVFGALYEINTGLNTIVVTLPTAVGNNGKTLFFIKIDSGEGEAVLTSIGGQTVMGFLTFELQDQFQFMGIVSDGDNWIPWTRN